MKRMELHVEHRYRDRVVGRHRLRSEDRTRMIGSSQRADLQLVGDQVSGFHASVEFQEGQWIISDMCSESGTWVSKQAVIEHAIKGETTVRIAQHELRLVPVEYNTDLFNQEQATKAQGQTKTMHQIVVRQNGSILRSLLLEKGQSFFLQVGDTHHELRAPSDTKWVRSEYAPYLVQQRLVDIDMTILDRIRAEQGAWESDFKYVMMFIFGLGLFLTMAILLFPMFHSQNLEKPVLEDNAYTKMIFDAKVVQKKKAQSAASKKQLMQNSAPSQAAASPAPTKFSGRESSTAKVIKSIQTSGLSALVGKISSRAAKNAIIVAGKGIRADEGSSGTATAMAIGSIGKDNGKGTFKVGGVATAGKGGGVGNLSGISGLGKGNVGNSEVGIVEEESEVTGGLDKEVIAAYIKSQLGQIRYCYERQLSATPDLYGKIQVKFVIGPSGAVTQQTIGSSTMKNAMVEGCILRRISGWNFPTPQGGTSVIVTYPFLFKSTN